MGKGTLNAIKRFDYFKRKASKNNNRTCYILKADIKHYFETVDHQTLMKIINKKIKDQKLLNLIKIILKNHKTSEKGKGMPLGNLTSQFFANVYLNELDYFVKHKLKVKYYLRYVDDFVILHYYKNVLQDYQKRINIFLKTKLKLYLHPDKSKICKLSKGISFLGFRIFYHYKLLRKKNLNRFERKFKELKQLYDTGIVSREIAVEKLEGWLTYTKQANTYKYRRNLIKQFNQNFPIQKPIIQVKKHYNFIRKTEQNKIQYSSLKTLQLYKKGLSIEQIAQQRNIKENTVWDHLAKLIEYNKLSLWKVLSKEKIKIILSKIKNSEDKLKDIKDRINSNTVNYNEINCVIAWMKLKNKKKNIFILVAWYQKTNCLRKCNKEQNRICKQKLNKLCSNNPLMKMTQNEFIQFFNKGLKICVLHDKEKS